MSAEDEARSAAITKCADALDALTEHDYIAARSLLRDASDRAGAAEHYRRVASMPTDAEMPKRIRLGPASVDLAGTVHEVEAWRHTGSYWTAVVVIDGSSVYVPENEWEAAE